MPVSNSTRLISFARPSAPKDPLFSNVVLLCGFNGSDGSTTFIDEGPLGLTLVGTDVEGTNTISTAQSVFGGSSLRLVGFGKIDLPSNSNLILDGDFTFEVRARFDNTDKMVILGGSSVNNFQFARESSTTFGNFPGFNYSTFSTPIDTWVALAWTRTGTTLRHFANGTLVGTYTNSTSFNFSEGQIGRLLTSLSPFLGYLDELRLTRACRYTASYTLATEPFPRS